MAKNKGKAGRPSPASAQGRARELPSWKWFFGHIFSLIRRHANVLVMWCGIGWCFYQVSQGFIAYAGRASVANLSLSILMNLTVVWTVSIVVSGLAITLYLKERGLHRRTRNRLTDRITELELRIDPQRTSSLLTPEGLTRKEDN